MAEPLRNLSPAHNLITDGLAVFSSLSELSELRTPYTLRMSLIAVCLKGEISALIDLAEHRMSGISMVVIRRGQSVHDISCSDDFSGLFLLIDERKFDGVLPVMTYVAPCMARFDDNTVVGLQADEVESVVTLHSLLGQKYRLGEQRPFNRHCVDALSVALFFEVLGIYTSRMDRRSHAASRSEELLAKFINLVEEDFRRERTVRHYARRLCLSPKHLSAAIKQASGLTAGQWIDRKVILEAKQMLCNSSMTIQEISAALNFANQSFFGKYFKHLSGMSPREFRIKSGR